jgi:hypothetical protein
MTGEEIDKIGEAFQSAYRTTQYFQALIYRSLYLSTLTISETSKKPELKNLLYSNQDISQSLEKYNEWQSKFASPEAIDKIIVEKSFVDKFQIFETLLFELIFSLFKHFPKFLNKSQSFTGISFDELFSSDNIEDLRTTVAENRTRQLLQFNSTRKTLFQVEILFGIDFTMGDEHIKQIHLISRLRNLIVHGDSLMTEATLNELKSENMEIGVAVCQSVIPFIKTKESYLDNILLVAGNRVLETIKSKIKQIAHYHNSKS